MHWQDHLQSHWLHHRADRESQHGCGNHGPCSSVFRPVSGCWPSIKVGNQHLFHCEQELTCAAVFFLLRNSCFYGLYSQILIKAKPKGQTLGYLGREDAAVTQEHPQHPCPFSISVQEKESPTCSSCVLLSNLQEKNITTWSWYFTHCIISEKHLDHQRIPHRFFYILPIQSFGFVSSKPCCHGCLNKRWGLYKLCQTAKQSGRTWLVLFRHPAHLAKWEEQEKN